MSSTRTRTKSSTKVAPPLFVPSYSFLAYPPQKEKPSQPLPITPKYTSIEPYTPVRDHRRPSFTNRIDNWVHSVQPGSPAPISPERRGSIASLTTTLVAFPSPDGKENRVESLESLGYTSAFLNLQGLPKRNISVSKGQGEAVPSQRTLKHSRSFSLFRQRTQSTPAPPSPTLSRTPTPTQAMMSSYKAPSRTHSRTHSVASTVTKSKKSKYTRERPPPLATDLALAQFMDGGNVEDQIKRYNDARAKSVGSTKVNGQLVGVGDVYRDENGNVWRDREEALEHARLLKDEAENGWVKFRSHLEASDRSGKAADLSAEDEERRGSVSTQATQDSQDSDLNPRYAMDAETSNDLAGFDRLKLDSPALSLPSQSQQVAKHLRKSEELLNTFPVPGSPRSPLTPRPYVSTAQSAPRDDSKIRRRPTPLELAPQSPAFVCPTSPPHDADELRRAFLDSSFAPAPTGALSPARGGIPSTAGVKPTSKQNMLNVNMKGLLKAVGRRK